MISPGYPEKCRRWPGAGESCSNCVSSVLASIVHTLPTPQTSIPPKRQVANSLQDLRPVSCDRKGPRRPPRIVTKGRVDVLPTAADGGMEATLLGSTARRNRRSPYRSTPAFSCRRRHSRRRSEIAIVEWMTAGGTQVIRFVSCVSRPELLFTRGVLDTPSFVLQHQVAVRACGRPPMAVWK